MRNNLARRVELGVGVLALVLALAVAAPVLGYHRPSAPVVSAPSGPSAEQVLFEQHQHAFMAELGHLMGAHACLPPDDWAKWRKAGKLRSYPARMIVQPVTATGLPTWGLVVKPWSFSNVGGYVKGLCVR